MTFSSVTPQGKATHPWAVKLFTVALDLDALASNWIVFHVLVLEKGAGSITLVSQATLVKG